MTYISEITVMNVQEKRLATPEEVEELIDTRVLFINYYLNDDGKVFIDLKDEAVGKFRLTK